MDLKTRLKAGGVTIGSWVTLYHTSIAEIMAKAGFDWLTVDMEHSSITLDQAQHLIQVIELSGIAPLVRVGENDAALIKRVMDSGAHGVIVPMVNTKDDALRAVSSVRYPPRGTRGVGLARAQGYGFEFQKYKTWANKGTILIVQIEHINAVENLDEILAVDGVDGFIVGPYDLSGSMGVPGELGHPKVRSALKRIMTVARRHKAVPGFHIVPPDPALAAEKIREGYRFLGLSFDAYFLGTMCREGLSMIRKKVRR